MREQLQEIAATVNRNKLRTFLTGFSVAWGIFMLIILLGSGNGLKNAMVSAFSDESINSFSVRNGWTSMPYKGFQNGRYIQLTEEDARLLKSEFPNQIVDITASCSNNNSTLSFGREFTSSRLIGVTPAFAGIEGVKILDGRFINPTDISDRRKVIVLDDLASKTLFKGTNPLGQMVIIDKMGYMVIGVYKGREYGNSSNAYIPLPTLFLTYKGGKRDVETINFTVQGLDTEEDITAFDDAIRTQLGAAHSFDPSDKSAIRVRNRMEFYKQAMMVFSGITLFVWIIGIGTLTAGVVGVSNIMLVTVRERTFEFGIRKALGAKPISLVHLVLVESVLITAIFGYIGMIGGVATMEVVNFFVERAAAAAPANDFQMFKNPTLNLSVTLSATLVLIIAGMIAGYVPARRAAQIKTIDAMRHNK